MSTVQAAQALALPREERGRALLRLPEDRFDRKSSRISGRDLADVLIGFANAEGGLVVIGRWVGQVEGVGSASNRQNEWRQAAADFTLPTVPARPRMVECVNDAGKADALFVVEVEPSDRVHANQKDEVHLRVGDENRRLTFGQRQELLYDKGQASYEVTPVGDAATEDLDQDLLASYAAALTHPDAARLLRARGLIDRRGNLTLAAILLFAEHPRRWVPEASIRILRYRGIQRGTGARQQLLEDVRIDGPIPMQLNAAQEAVFRLLPTRRALARTGRFERIGIIPRDAWLEGLVNAAIHRSYSITGDLVEASGYSRPVVVKQLNALRDVGLIERIGKSRKDPRAYWRLKRA